MAAPLGSTWTTQTKVKSKCMAEIHLTSIPALKLSRETKPRQTQAWRQPRGEEKRTRQGRKTGPCAGWPLLLHILPFRSQAGGRSWDRLLPCDIGRLALGRLLMAPLKSAGTPSAKAASLGGRGSWLARGRKRERTAETQQQRRAVPPEAGAAAPALRGRLAALPG